MMPLSYGNAIEWQRDDYLVTTDRSKVDVAVVHNFLAHHSGWSRNIPLALVQKQNDNSLCFSLFSGDQQIGFARIISDLATVAYLGDVFVLPEHRGKGLARWLMECVTSHPDLQGLRRWVLATSDAHGLYAKFGFTPVAAPEKWMERFDPDVYRR